MWLTRKLAAFTSPLDRNQVTTKRLVFHEDTEHNSNLSRTTTNSSSLSSTAFDPVVKPLPRTPDSTPIITNVNMLLLFLIPFGLRYTVRGKTTPYLHHVQ